MLFSVYQLLCEDLHRPQGVGPYGAAQPGRHTDRQLLQWPNSARVGRGLQRVQGWATGAWTCGGVHLLGTRECLPHHPRRHRLRGKGPLRHWGFGGITNQISLALHAICSTKYSIFLISHTLDWLNFLEWKQTKQVKSLFCAMAYKL